MRLQFLSATGVQSGSPAVLTALPFHQPPKPKERQSMDAEDRYAPQLRPPAAATLQIAAADLRSGSSF